ncbi:MAG TPA: Gfo/Idh/MocA family oxidoreductase [Casimicrobiaceae bacterium]|nr:Gfo/Idh/MocA family oxidoreductase [Casimicrobiaceae bacterium]
MTTIHKIRLGVVGLGRAFTLMLPTFVADERVELAGAADSRPEARRRFESDFGARAYDSIEPLCNDSSIEAIYVASPHQLHAEHARLAVASGKHVLVEKPMALSVGECQSMIDAARRARVQLIVGHSHSFDAPVLRTRELIASGAFGSLRMLTALNFTDFIYRPRRPEELSTREGGGVVFSQAAHQIDVVRLLAGGLVRAVRAFTGQWDPSRATEGAYSALLQFADGTFASLTYSGYAHFDSDEICGDIGEMGRPRDPARYGAARRTLASVGSASEESQLKASRGYGGAHYSPSTTNAPHHQHFGFVIASCERADLRLMPDRLLIYGDSEVRTESLPPPTIPRREVIDELYDAVVHGRAPLHGGEWALATTEACLALLQSAREGREIALQHQVACS